MNKRELIKLDKRILLAFKPDSGKDSCSAKAIQEHFNGYNRKRHKRSLRSIKRSLNFLISRGCIIQYEHNPDRYVITENGRFIRNILLHKRDLERRCRKDCSQRSLRSIKRRMKRRERAIHEESTGAS